MLIDGPDCRLWVERRGEGEPVTIFAHGVTGSSAETQMIAGRTPGTAVLFDFRGHGRSECPPAAAGYDHDAMRRDLEHVADWAGATNAAGISMGASAICATLARRPDRFSRVVLLLPAALDSLTNHPFPALADALERRPLSELAAEALEAPEYRALFDARPYWRALVEARILRMNATGVPRALRAYASGSPPVPDPDGLRRVAADVLLLAHEADPVHDVAVARRLNSLLPSAELQTWSEPLAMFDDLDALNRIVADFLASPPLPTRRKEGDEAPEAE